MGLELVILIGLQASGKSTFYRTYFAGSHVHISKDLLRNNRRPARRQRQLIEEALQAGRSVVIDNTNPGKAERAELIELARQYGATVSGYYFLSRPGESLERNKERQGKERVPDIAIFATLKPLEPPADDEGFEHLYTVRIEGEGKFQIREAKEEENRDE